jgi:hypothetical protein
MYMRKNRKVHLMDIFTIQMVRQDLNRANAEMHSVKENSLMAIVMMFLGAGLVAISSSLYFGYTVSTEGMIFLLIHGVAGIAAIICAIVMIVNAVKDFRRASRRMRVASSNMYQMEERLLRKTA